MSLHVDNHNDGNGDDHPRIALIAVAVVLLFTCVALLYMGNTYRVAPTHITRQPLASPL